MKALFYSAVLLLPAVVGFSAQAQASTDGVDALRHTIIAISGTPAPVVGNYLPFSFFNVTLNTRHQVAFDAIVAGSVATSAVFVGDGKATSTIALGISPDPNAPSFGFVSNPFITSTGDVVFDVSDVGIFMSKGETSVPLVRVGDAAPGGGTMGPPGTRAANDQGAVAYEGRISGSSAATGIFRTTGNQTVAIARDDKGPPTGGSFSLLGEPVINERGQVAFFSAMSGGTADFGVFRGEGAELTPIFVSGQLVPAVGGGPAGGATLQDFGGVVINRHGQVAALALTTGTSAAGIFLGDGTSAVSIALDGEAAPKGGIYRDPSGRGTFRGAIRLNDRGDVAFDAILTGSSSTSGIFRGTGERTTAVALAQTSAPGTTGVFESFDDLKLGVDGRVAFIGTLKLGVGGVDATNNKGIWIGTSEEDLRLVVRTGDVIGGKALTQLPRSGQANQFDMNENGVVWVGNFGVAKGVVFSRIVGDNE